VPFSTLRLKKAPQFKHALISIPPATIRISSSQQDGIRAVTVTTATTVTGPLFPGTRHTAHRHVNRHKHDNCHSNRHGKKAQSCW
jgi:hypothetical protein